MRDAFDERASILMEQGNACQSPISEFLRDGIFELRVRAGKEQTRFLYYFGEQRTIVFVNAIFKKKGKTPPDEIKKAIQRRTTIKSGERATHVYYIN